MHIILIFVNDNDQFVMELMGCLDDEGTHPWMIFVILTEYDTLTV